MSFGAGERAVAHPPPAEHGGEPARREVAPEAVR